MRLFRFLSCFFIFFVLLFSNYAHAVVVLSGVRALYHLEDISDSSGNGYDLTNNNGVTFEPGKLRKAANGGSDNTSKFLSVAKNLGISGRALSISAWFKMTGVLAPGQQAIASHNSAASNSAAPPYIIEQTGVWNDAGNKKAFTYRGYNNVKGYYSTYSTSVDDGNWHHIVLTFDGTNLVNWYDGVQRSVTKIPARTGSPGLINSFWILAWSDLGLVHVAHFKGMIDEVVVLNRVLTNMEIASLWNGGAGDEVVIGTPTVSPFLQSLVLSHITWP